MAKRSWATLLLTAVLIAALPLAAALGTEVEPYSTQIITQTTLVAPDDPGGTTIDRSTVLSAGEQLPKTGLNVEELLTAGLIALLIGLTVVGVTRRPAPTDG